MAWNCGKGRGYKWLIDNASHANNDCLIWPYTCDTRGYGQVGYRGKVLRASRLMCQIAHGDPPTEKHQAAHSCGNGAKGCVNPRHLSWKTNSENQYDRRRHGTHGGSLGYVHTKLTPEKVRQIRALRGIETQKDLARKFGVSDATIRGVQTGRWWKHVTLCG